jgi:hypothetical protein
MTLTDPAITLQVKEDDEVLEPYRLFAHWVWVAYSWWSG